VKIDADYIEMAFERFCTLPGKKGEKCHDFHNKYKNEKNRFRAIWENVIDNLGYFQP